MNRPPKKKEIYMYDKSQNAKVYSRFSSSRKYVFLRILNVPLTWLFLGFLFGWTWQVLIRGT
jgi:hypothetical protein